MSFLQKPLILILVLFFILLFASCIDNGAGTPGGDGDQSYADPDPLTSDELSTAPDAPSDLFIVVNVDGEIRAFNADSPSEYELLVTDASTDDYLNNIILSDNSGYLLYVKAGESNDLILYDITNDTRTPVREGIASNEAQFIDDDNIQYSYNSDIYHYYIPTGAAYVMINNDQLECNHGASVSPEGDKIVFKNQDPNDTETADIAWAAVTGTTVSTCTHLDTYDGDYISLYENFEFTWKSDTEILMKLSPGSNNKIRLYNTDTDTSFPDTADLINSGSSIAYFGIAISDDVSKLCLYGSYGVYFLDITTETFSGDIEVEEIYKSEYVTTDFAAFSIDSDYMVVSTSKVIGVYDANTLEQTTFDSSAVIGKADTIYSIDCK